MHVLGIALAVALSVPQGSDTTVRVSPGRQQILKIPGVTKVAISDPGVADVTVTGPGELLVTARRLGKTGLLLWTKSGQLSKTIIVDDGKTDELTRLIHESVNATLSVQSFQDRIIIDGRVDSMNELRRLRTLVGDDPNVKILVTLNPDVMPFIASQINEAFEKNGLHNAHAVVLGGHIVLEGSVTDEVEKQKAQQIADSFYGTMGT